jgi:hypothetical protein
MYDMLQVATMGLSKFMTYRILSEGPRAIPPKDPTPSHMYEERVRLPSVCLFRQSGHMLGVSQSVDEPKADCCDASAYLESSISSEFHTSVYHLLLP